MKNYLNGLIALLFTLLKSDNSVENTVGAKRNPVSLLLNGKAKSKKVEYNCIKTLLNYARIGETKILN